jgi:hypothetical protein
MGASTMTIDSTASSIIQNGFYERCVGKQLTTRANASAHVFYFHA